MERISDRHEGDLEGQLQPFTDAEPVVVAVVVAPATAHLAAAQHTAWMLVNLLARTDGIVEAVHVICPPSVSLAGRVVPLAPRDASLDDALIAGGRAIGAAPVDIVATPGVDDLRLIVGHDPDHAVDGHAAHRYVVGHGWWGGLADHPLCPPPAASALPFGPYVAAALAVGEVYLGARLPVHTARVIGNYGWDCWAQCLADHPISGAPTDLRGMDLSGIALAGVGAVGSTWVHALWATPRLTGNIILADADSKGVDTTNLNRCPLFGHASLNRPKAHEAARIARNSAITWEPHHGPLEAHLRTMPRRLVSAVDTNRARSALQNRYAPSMLSGSTRDVRAEVLRAGPPGVGACLRCYNPPEALVGDDALRAQARNDGPETIRQLALEIGVNEAEIRRSLDRGQCDEVSRRLLDSLRQTTTSESPPRFAVGFTSVMAGVMLAAETIKATLGHEMVPGQVEMNNVTFQFLKPTSRVNTAVPLAPDPTCPACEPRNPASAIWQRRIDDSTVTA